MTTQVVTFVKEYSVDFRKKLLIEMKNIKAIHFANLGKDIIPQLELLKKLNALKILNLFPDICIRLRIFCTIPVTVADTERSLRQLALIKNVIRSTMY